MTSDAVNSGGMEAGVFFVGNPASLTSLDVACGMPLGCNSSPPPAPHRSSFDEFTTRLFSSSFGRGPCYMPFSGGSESSTWLAVATRYARRHGHDDPVPITLRYPGLASPEQLGLQERVIAQLDLADWEGVAPDEALELIGPVASGALPRTALAAARVRDGAAAGGGTGGRVRTSDRSRRFLLLVAVGAACERRFGSPAGEGPRCCVARLDPDACGLARAGCAATGHAAADFVAATGGRKTRAGAFQNHAGSGPRGIRPRLTTQITHRCFTGAAGTFRALGQTLGTTTDHHCADPAWWRRWPVLAGAWFAEQRAFLQQLGGDLLPSDARGGPHPISPRLLRRAEQRVRHQLDRRRPR